MVSHIFFIFFNFFVFRTPLEEKSQHFLIFRKNNTISAPVCLFFTSFKATHSFNSLKITLLKTRAVSKLLLGYSRDLPIFLILHRYINIMFLA